MGWQASLALRWQKLEGLLGQVGGAEALFMHLHGQQGASDTFWLDRCTTVPIPPPPVDEQLLGNKQHGGHVSCIQLLAEHKAKHGVEQAPLSAPSLVCNKILDLLTLHMRQHR